MRTTPIYHILGLACLLWYSPALSAQLSLPSLFSDHMVLQYKAPVRIWGKAQPNEWVRIELANRLTITYADENGDFLGTLAPISNIGPHHLIVETATESQIFYDVLMGDVYVCVGQSNMKLPLEDTENAATAIAEANFPDIRYFAVPQRLSPTPARDLPGGAWQHCNPDVVADFSALAYYFGRDIHLRTGLPIGIIEAAWGSTRIETWMSPDALADDPEAGPIIANMGTLNLAQIQDSIATATAEWEESIETTDIGLTNNWELNDVPGWQEWPSMLLPRNWESGGLPYTDGAVWFKTSFLLSAEQAESPILMTLGKLDDSDQTYVNGQLVGQMGPDPGAIRVYEIPADCLQEGENIITVRIRDYGFVGGFTGSTANLKLQQDIWQSSLVGYWKYQLGTVGLAPRPEPLGPNSYPCLAYNGMIHPLTKLSMRGMLWYQGESDLGNPYYYRDQFLDLLDDYRQQWEWGDFPFFFVQLPNFRPEATTPAESGWATMRESQALLLQRPRTAMAVAIDAGDPNNIHPPKKRIVAERLAQAAWQIVYEQEGGEYRNPTYSSHSVQNGEVIIQFDYVGDGLESIYGNEFLHGFAIADAEGDFIWAKAEIRSNNTVAVFHPNVPNPLHVRYAWSDNPGTLDLYNSEGLPASSFRTDSFILPWQ